MGIEKMSLVSVEGTIDRLDDALMLCSESHAFQIADIKGAVLKNLNEQNPYLATYTKMADLARGMGIMPEFCRYDDVKLETGEEFERYYSQIVEKYSGIRREYEETKAALEEHSQTDAYVKHLLGLDVGFNDLFSMKYVKLRIGRLPIESEEKLEYYYDHPFIFYPFERNSHYVWGLYVVPTALADFADELMTSLYFERTILPAYLYEDAEESDQLLEKLIAREAEQKAKLEQELSYLADSLRGDFMAVLSKLKYKSECFELRKKAVIAEGKYYFSGYCPSTECKKLCGRLKEMGASIVEIPQDRKNASAEVPVRLRNNFLTKPFEMFVEMYGLPAYGSMDPTPYVAVTYMLLFGIMFGDVGQGLVISLLGLLLTKLTKNGLAPIMTRIGLFSAAFGVLYGSVFGIETIITPFFHREAIWNGICGFFSGLGLPPHPENIFQAATVLLLASLALGIILILVSMIINMVLSFREKKLGEALFGVNGAAGIVLYSSLVAGLVGTLLFGLKLFTPVYIVLLIVLPVVLIFLKHPLTCLVTNEKPAEKMSIGNFIVENFIELFEAAISFLSNTMSFLRVGGFVMSHAGFMLVVSQLSGAAAGEMSVKTVIVYIIGNIVVMGIEGLLVGIQVLRLEFYEIFSRFYDGSGKGFRPIEISFETE